MDRKRIIMYVILFFATLAIATQGFTKLGLDGLLVPLLFTFAYFTIIFIIATAIKDNSIIDMDLLGYVI